MLRGRVSLMPFINWGQVISVTAENVLGADVTLTFLERKVQKTKSQKISQEEERGKNEIASPQLSSRMKTNQLVLVHTPGPTEM